MVISTSYKTELDTNTAADMTGVRDFLHEGLRMQHFSHPRVMQLTGISFDEHFAPMIITPYMHNGDLLKYLREPSNVRN